VLLQPAESDPVVGVSVGEQDADEALSEALDPVSEGVDLVARDERVDEEGLGLACDEGAAARGPHGPDPRFLGARIWYRPHGGDVDVDAQPVVTGHGGFLHL